MAHVALIHLCSVNISAYWCVHNDARKLQHHHIYQTDDFSCKIELLVDRFGSITDMKRLK